MGLLRLDFGVSDGEQKDIGRELRERFPASLGITVPMFVLEEAFAITLAMFIALFRGTYVDFWGTVLCVLGLSISYLFYIIAGQYWLGRSWHLCPISGYHDGLYGMKFLLLPVVVGVAHGIGAGIRVNRTYFLEETGRDYVRTARAKGLPETLVLYKHALKNAMIPIVTSAVAVIPFLFMGALVTEAFFSIPGLGGYTIEAINANDFAIVRSMVFLGALLTVLSYLLVDIAYTFVDPRIRLQ